MQKVLFDIRSNPYGLKYTPHYLRKSYQRCVHRVVVDEKLLSEIPVGIQKTLGYSNRFELIFEFNNDDVYIVVDIINSDEICIITVMPKDKKRRKH